MATNLELYEALKKTLDEDAARMIAEVVPVASDIATKDDVRTLSEGLVALSNKLDTQIGRVERKIDQLEARQLRWTIGLFAPLWVAVLVMLAAIIIKL